MLIAAWAFWQFLLRVVNNIIFIVCLVALGREFLRWHKWIKLSLFIGCFAEAIVSKNWDTNNDKHDKLASKKNFFISLEPILIYRMYKSFTDWGDTVSVGSHYHSDSESQD